MKKLIVCLMALFIMGCSSSDSEYTLSDAEKAVLTDINNTEFAWN